MIPATLEQLKSLRWIVYGILNKRNGRWYIGQTVKTFWRRYACKASWWEVTHNTYLQRAVRKYGGENFEIYLFEHSLTSMQEMNRLEELYINQYNSIYPNGYNFNTGGENREWSDFSKSKRSKKYTIKDSSGNIIEVINGAKFCREHEINTGDFWRMLSGRQLTAGGFSLPDTNLLIHRRGENALGYVFLKHRSGKIVQVYNLSEFARVNNINHSSLCAMVSGKNKRCGDWFLPETDVNFRQKIGNKRWKTLVLEKDGKELVVDNSAEFGRNYKVGPDGLSRLVNSFNVIGKRGKPFTVKGFVLKKINWL